MCRGYICPKMVDRISSRQQWESYGFVLEKNSIGVRIFSAYERQPALYQALFDKLVKKIVSTAHVTLDFCPNNVAINPDDGGLYLIDLEDIQPIDQLTNQQIVNIWFQYNPNDYLDEIITLSKIR